jgi:hypothetical protein
MINNLNKICENIKNKNPQLKDYTYICPDDRKYIECGNIIKYVNINNISKVKTGKILQISLDKVLLKSLNSSITWTIKFTNNHIFYKFIKDDLIDAINELMKKNEKNIK